MLAPGTGRGRRLVACFRYLLVVGARYLDEADVQADRATELRSVATAAQTAAETVRGELTQAEAALAAARAAVREAAARWAEQKKLIDGNEGRVP